MTQFAPGDYVIVDFNDGTVNGAFKSTYSMNQGAISKIKFVYVYQGNDPVLYMLENGARVSPSEIRKLTKLERALK